MSSGQTIPFTGVRLARLLKAALDPPLPDLIPRVLRRWSNGLDTTAIARELELSEATTYNIIAHRARRDAGAAEELAVRG